LGGFELLVLLALMRLGDEAYGVPISQAIEGSSGREVALGSVYVTRDRLEGKGSSPRH
jgi:DNA-binding PadR family transcriptional regulator